jgi:hypothetical protein
VVGVLTRHMANDFFVRDGALLFWALAGVLFGYALRQGPTSGEHRVSASRTTRRCGAAATATFRPGSLGVGTRVLAMAVGAVTLAGGVSGPSGVPEVMGTAGGDRGRKGAS